MQKTNTCKLGVIILTLAMLTTAFAVLPNVGAGGAANESAPNETVYHIKGKVLSFYTNQPIFNVEVNAGTAVKSVKTGTDGTFDLLVISNLTTIVTFTHDQYKATTTGVLTADFNGTTTANVGEIGMERLPSISGIVKSTTEGELSNVKVVVNVGNTPVGNATTAANGAYTVYANTASTSVNVIYSKVGYYENETDFTLTMADNIDVDPAYLKKITPEPVVKLDGYVQAGANYLQGVHVSVSRDGTNWISNYTDNRGYYAIYSFSGWLQVKAEMTGYYNYDEPVYVNETDDNRFYLGISLTQIAVGTGVLDGQITNKVGGAPIDGATVELHVKDALLRTYVKTFVTPANGSYNFTGISFTGATCELSVSKDGFFTNSTIGVTAATLIRDVHLWPINNNRNIKGFVRDAENHPIPGATVTMHSDSWIYEMSAVTEDPSGYFEIISFDGDFNLLANADGFQGKLVPVSVSGADIWVTINLNASETDTVIKTYEFSDDWSIVTLNETRTLDIDNVILRSFADMTFGRGTFGLTPNNWSVAAQEIDDGDPSTMNSWVDYMRAQGLPEIYTDDILAFDNIYYELNIDSYNITIYNAGGAIADDSLGAIVINITATYDIMDSPVESAEHEILFNASYDSALVNRSYNIALPYGYEMTANTTSTGSVKVTGFTTVNIDALEAEGVEHISMTVEESEEGEAKIRLTDGVFYEVNSTTEGYEVFVRMADNATAFNSTVEFSAADSTDPVGLIQLANFAWDFEDDGTVDAYGMKVTNNFSTAKTFLVNLTVTETGNVDGNNVTERTATVHVDGEAPTAVIKVINHTIESKTITIEEDNKTTFSGMDSTDPDVGTTKGIIQTWQWSWGDGTANDTVTKGGEAYINHTYAKPGTYTARLNVTDVVGHVSTDKNLTVVVEDITKPNTDFNILNSNYTIVTGCREDLEFFFNVTTTDNYDDWDNMTYTWDFGDDTDMVNVSGAAINVTHTFDEVGTFNVTLNSTDAAGNWAIKTVPVVVSLGIRPDLMLYSTTLKMDPKTIDAGEKVELSVNFTNKGEADATGVTVTFYVRNADGDDEPISGTVSIVDKDGTAIGGTLLPGKNATASLVWKPSGKGNYTIYVSANCTNEHSTTMYDNNNGATLTSSYVQVNESPMMQYIIVGIAVAAFVVIVVIYYVWMRGKTSGGSLEEKRKKK
jgi:hypothetical protein